MYVQIPCSLFIVILIKKRIIKLTHPAAEETPNLLGQIKWGVPGLDGLKNLFMGSIGFGFLLGFATGFAVKLFGEVLMLVLGSQVFIMQLLARGEVIHVELNFVLDFKSLNRE